MRRKVVFMGTILVIGILPLVALSGAVMLHCDRKLFIAAIQHTDAGWCELTRPWQGLHCRMIKTFSLLPDTGIRNCREHEQREIEK